MNKPNLMRVASELASSMETKPPAPLPESEGQNNNERFNALLNSCENPRAVYNALLSFAEDGRVDRIRMERR